jgi:hypothetical protein
MIRSESTAESPRESGSLRWLKTSRWVVFGLFLLSWCILAAGTSGAMTLPGNPAWPPVLLLIAAAVSTLVSLTRELPGQNVLLAAAIIGALGGLIQEVGGWAAILANLTSPATGPAQNAFLWWIPLVWIIALLNSRGTARLILRSWRQTPTYGIQVLALTTALSLLFIAGLEAFATSAGTSWFANHGRTGWNGFVPGHLPAFVVATVIILILVTPILIRKKPVSSPPDFFPLITWALLTLLFAIGVAGQLLRTAGLH